MANENPYAHYSALTLKPHPNGILEVVMGASQSANKKLSTADHNLHRELAPSGATSTRTRPRAWR